MFPETLKERQALSFVTTTTINSGGTASASTPGLDMSKLRRCRAFLVCGTITGAGSVNFVLQQAATLNGSYTTITGNTTNPSVTGIVTDDSLNCLEIRADQITAAGGPFVRATATETAGQNAVVTIILIGDESSYKPGNQFNASTPTNDVVTTT